MSVETTEAPQVQRLPNRHEVSKEDQWDLSSLFESPKNWEEAFQRWEASIPRYEEFRGTLSKSAADLLACLTFDSTFDREAERLGTYAFLRTTEDTSDSDSQSRRARFVNVASRAQQVASYIRPELMAIDDATVERYLQDETLALFHTQLQRIFRYKPYTLSEQEERLLAMQAEMSDTANQAFRQLTDADLKFGEVADEGKNRLELTHSTFSRLLHSPDREVRKTAFHQYYEQYSAHENALGALLEGSIQRDVYYARARGYDSALGGALFADDVPQSVYDNLVAAVRDNLDGVYKYLDLRRRAMKLDDIHHYDTYVPIVSDLKMEHSWDQAVEVVIESLQPLGEEYCTALAKGLRGRWCDRYENQGKQSGAFSCGSFDAEPFILMNYQPSVLNHVFTLTHEAGHSMHSYFSSKYQPYEYYDYVIFVAEVASTFNEQLLSKHLLANATDDRQRAYFINREIDDIRGTIIRQTMFAEFEKISHAMVEAGEPLTLAAIKDVYGKLLADYFGPDFKRDDCLSLECLRIPHFYRAFYVYKYATGMSAAIALAERVTGGGPQELGDYLGFLKAGCSKFPLEILRDAGVDMSQRAPVDTALKRFSTLVDELDSLL